MKKILSIVILFVNLIFISGCVGSSGIGCSEDIYEFNNCDVLENCECIHTAPLTEICTSCECVECFSDSTEIKVGRGCESIEKCECVSQNIVGTCVACLCQKGI